MPIFTKDELDANNRRKKTLIEFIKSKEAILMAGAGCSASLFPAWGDFMDLLELAAINNNRDFKEDKSDFLSFADRVKETLGEGRYYGLIHDTFKPGKPTHHKFHEVLCRLPFRGITTTNYDRVLEYALNKVVSNPDNSLHFEGTTKNKIHEFLLSLNYNVGIPKRIAHLHGICDENESIVLGGKEYASKYGFSISAKSLSIYDKIKSIEVTPQQLQDLLLEYGYEWPIRRKLLWSLLATRRIFFIGFSMSDPYFIKMLDYVKEDLSTYNSQSHFLLLRVTSETYQRDKNFADSLKSEYGIETVFFEEETGVYAGLGNFIAELEAEVNASEVVLSKIEPDKASNISEGDKELTDKLFQISIQKDLDEN